jgi:hypothetical protein
MLCAGGGLKRTVRRVEPAAPAAPGWRTKMNNRPGSRQCSRARAANRRHAAAGGRPRTRRRAATPSGAPGGSTSPPAGRRGAGGRATCLTCLRFARNVEDTARNGVAAGRALAKASTRGTLRRPRRPAMGLARRRQTGERRRSPRRAHPPFPHRSRCACACAQAVCVASPGERGRPRGGKRPETHARTGDATARASRGGTAKRAGPGPHLHSPTLE